MLFERGSPARCFTTPPPQPPSSWKSRLSRSPTVPFSERKKSPNSANKNDLFHIIHKVPAGDSPYVKAKQVQLVDKDPGRAISLFWAAINAGDRVESALKDMALVMKQLNRSDEAIEAIKSFRHLCPLDSQDSLDNILVELYKRSGRVDEEIAMLHHKLKQIEDGVTFVGRTTKQARSQGKKIQITAEQEISRILGNLAWAYLQKEDYKTAEEHYRKALSFEVDRNKQCNLAICLMHMNRIKEAKFLLQAVSTATKNRKMDDSFVKSFERASQMLIEIESSSSDNAAFSVTSKSQCSPQSFETSIEKSSDSIKSRTENRSVTSEGDVSHARRRLYQSPDCGRRDLNVPCTKPKRCSWGFNNGYRRETWGDVHSDSKSSFGTPPNNVKHATRPRENGLSSPANGKWRSRTLEDPSIPRHEGTTAVASSNSLHTLNTEAAIEFTEKEKPAAYDSSYRSTLSESHVMVVNGANEFASGNRKPLEKKSWADIVEEEQDEQIQNDFFSGYISFDGEDGAEVFNDENEDSNIIYQCPWPQNQIECSSKKLELDQKDGASGSAILSRNPTARRSLCFNAEPTSEPAYFFCTSKSPRKASNLESRRILARERDSLTGEKKQTRRNRLQDHDDG
ncbi:protein POLLENLESS 3 isoform X2 [Cajanus cajan]|uniref:protein POLLENLESS 3 isoform X2 n=1 Tax=Cajanus cajan TaxID=3821 RepID=UPI00098DCB1F|nr:protein POLLENLESS 3 isoform X2 [Cajanus cajan]